MEDGTGKPDLVTAAPPGAGPREVEAKQRRTTKPPKKKKKGKGTVAPITPPGAEDGWDEPPAADPSGDLDPERDWQADGLQDPPTLPREANTRGATRDSRPTTSDTELRQRALDAPAMEDHAEAVEHEPRALTSDEALLPPAMVEPGTESVASTGGPESRETRPPTQRGLPRRRREREGAGEPAFNTAPISPDQELVPVGQPAPSSATQDRGQGTGTPTQLAATDMTTENRVFP